MKYYIFFWEFNNANEVENYWPQLKKQYLLTSPHSPREHCIKEPMLLWHLIYAIHGAKHLTNIHSSSQQSCKVSGVIIVSMAQMSKLRHGAIAKAPQLGSD